MDSSQLSGPKRVKHGWMRVGNDCVVTSKGCRNGREGIGGDCQVGGKKKGSVVSR